MVSKLIWGVFLLSSSGFIGVGELVFSKVLLAHGWPYFKLKTANLLFIAGVLGISSMVSRERWPTQSEWKWVLLRPMFGNATLIVAVHAVSAGAAPGDTTA